jgi:FkbM family methyltransferase
MLKFAHEGLQLALPSTLRSLRSLVNRTLKLDIVTLGHAGTLKGHIGEILRRYRVDTAVDVGANEGQFGAMLRDIGFEGQIHSFEPVKQPFDSLLRSAAKDGRWAAHNVALGSARGTATINVSEDSVFSSLLPSRRYGLSYFGNMRVARQEEIQICTFHDFHKHHLQNGERIFLKLDTQGYDLKVFEGASSSLGNVCCLLSELSMIPLYEGMPTYLEALAAYEAKGFSISGMFPVTRNDDASVIEVDCMLVNRALYRTLA